MSHGVYITSKGAFWRKPAADFRFYSKKDIKEVMDYIIDNAYFQVSNKIFRQIKGIPLGSDPATVIANLFLYPRKLRHAFRFIEDLITLNDDDEFLRSYLDIYPKEMELKVENQNTQTASHLDLDLEINDGIFNSKLYAKPFLFL